MKKLLALLLAAVMVLGCVSALADNIKMDKLTFEFVPSKDADVIITGTKNLPELVQAEMAKLGYDIGEVDITVGTNYNATGEAMAAGSIDVIGAVRSSLLIAHDPDNDARRIMVQLKANLAPLENGIAFFVNNEGITFDEAVQFSADELLNRIGSVQRGRPPAKMNKAMLLLKDFLSEMERSQEMCMAMLEENGIAASTAKKAKSELGIESLKIGSRWYWKLPC